MKILFINYWGFQEGLTQATSLPHLKLLADFPEVEHVWFSTIERLGPLPAQALQPEITHLPFHSKAGLQSKLGDFISLPRQLTALVYAKKIDFIICRGAPAGAIGYLVWRKTQVPYAVESYEPHANYMLESHVWKPWDPRYLLQKRWESKIKQTATALMPVAEGYRQQLKLEGVPQYQIFTQPCAVASQDFFFNPDSRTHHREQLGLSSEAMIGVYVGKFGGLYLRDEAFRLFKAAFDAFGEAFYLILLSPNPTEEVQSLCAKHHLPPNRVIHRLVPHSSVPCYLHSADFAFATYKPSPTKRFLSPIKVGEFWAAGLPVVLTEGVGDDAEIIQKAGGGVLFHPDHAPYAQVFDSLRQELSKPKSAFMELATKYRSLENSRKVYQSVFRLLQTTS